MQSVRKNIGKSILFILLLLLPQWVARILFVSLNPDLTVTHTIDYLTVALRFDLKTVVIWYAPLFILLGIGLIWKPKWLYATQKILFIVLYSASLIFTMVSVFYYPFSKSIAGVELWQMVKGQDVGVLMGYIKYYWWVIVVSILVLYAAYRLFCSLSIKLTTKQAILWNIVSLVILALFARGSFALKPLNLLDAYATLEPQEAISAVTPTYVLIESFGKSHLEEYHFYSQDKMIAELNEEQISMDTTYFETAPNICLVLLESFGKEYTSLNTSNRPSYTTFLDSLMKVSLNFTNAYANGLRSMDATASIFSGIPSLMKQPFIGSLYSQNHTQGVLKPLAEKGYYTSFYHAADQLSMGFKPYLLSQGLNYYVGKQQYPDINDFDGTWGIFDGPFLQFFANELSQQPQPWFSSVFTLSSHHPYSIPEEYDSMPEGTHPIHKSVEYTDACLRAFFSTARNMSWFKNTIFIITADHTSVNQTPEYQNYRGKYAIPLLIYSPLVDNNSVVEKPVQHIDINATIKIWAGVKEQKSRAAYLLNNEKSELVHFDGNIYTYTTDSLCLEWNGASNIKLYNYVQDPSHALDISADNSEVTHTLLTRLQMQMQKFNYKMINNKF